MRTISIIAMVTVLAIAIAGFGSAGTASAAHVVTIVNTSDVFEVGQPGQLQVTLLSDNQPLANTLITVFYTGASFGGVTGDVVIGTMTTKEDGIALFEYEPRHASTHELRLEFLAPGDTEPTSTVVTVSVAGSAQVYQSTSGIQVPGLNVWLIIAIISSLWALLFSVGWRVFAIAQAGTDAKTIVTSESAARGTWI
ncbi:MAG: hypothetical protein ACC645_19810 [Pirellulales bacterium]